MDVLYLSGRKKLNFLSRSRRVHCFTVQSVVQNKQRLWRRIEDVILEFCFFVSGVPDIVEAETGEFDYKLIKTFAFSLV